MQTDTEWIAIVDPVRPNETYLFDKGFFLSHHNCIYGRGCKGMNLNPTDGCCNVGARLTAREILRTKRTIDLMQPEDAANYKKISKLWYTPVEDSVEGFNTRIVNDTCIFSNPADHAYPGCALYRVASQNDIPVDDARPSACSLYPLNVDLIGNQDGGMILYRVGPARREKTWAEEGTDWWCVDDHAAYSPDHPLAYKYYRSTIDRYCGAQVGQKLHEYCEALLKSGVALPDGYGAPSQPKADGRFSTTAVTITTKPNRGGRK